MELSSIFIFKSIGNDVDSLKLYRTNFTSESDALKWLDEYSKISYTNWIVKNGVYNPQRLVYHKHFVCQHAARNKKQVSGRNTQCLASIDIKIKKCNKATRKNDLFLKKVPPLAGIVKMNINHNHAVNTCESLKFLRMDDETRQQYIKYFEDGLGVSESIKQHENRSLLSNISNLPEVAANSQVNPSYNMVKNLFDKWKKEHFGSVIDNIERIKEKIPHYAKQYISIQTNKDHPWAILVVTPIMRRCQDLIDASEIIFVDSTCSVDATNATLTIMFTASKAGALPICVMIHEGQTEESYKQAFALLKKFNTNAFGAHQYPAAFMTHNSEAEKNALKAVWPKSRQLLCLFHVAQAEWRWLISVKNGIPESIRRTYMQMFKKVMYASSQKEFGELANNLLISNIKANYKKRFEDFLEIKEEWGVCFRKNLITRGYDANNYSEATMRIIKDIILQRTRAFNAVTLVDYFSTVWEQYCKVRLISFATGHKDKSYSKLNFLKTAVSNFDISSITTTNNIIFKIPKPTFSKSNVIYEVDSDLGLCSCRAGLQGAFCKHQYLINKYFKKIVPSAPTLSSIEKYNLAKIALGDELKSDVSFFDGLQPKNNDSYLNTEIYTVFVDCDNLNNGTHSNVMEFDNENDIAFEENIISLKNNLNRLHDLLPRTAVTNKYLSQINKQLSKITSDQDALNLLIEINSLFRK